jgi:outer membrane protein assembly factor BamB/plastocyanin
VYASPLIYDGMLMIGVSGGAAELGPAEDRYPFEGSMNFLDANTGRLIKKTWTIHPPKQPPDNYAGGTIWSTPAIDPQDKVAFVGAGNPFQQQAEHPHTDAVLKFDINPASPTFGEIIGSYKGQVDTYASALRQLPCIAIPNNPPPYYPQGVGGCGQIDQDFGASPNLFRDASGRELVGAGQKSGVYHVFDAKTMKPVWQTITGIPTSVGGIVGSTAIDGESIYGPDTVPGYVWSLSQSNGAMRWIGPIADGAHWGPPVTYANGVVYSVDFSGFLDAFDARNGVLLNKRPLGLGGEGVANPSWGAVSIARHTIYASIGVLGLANGSVVALRPGAAGDIVGDIGKTNPLGSGGSGGSGGGGGGGGPQGPSVVAGPGAASTGYATPAVIAFAGGKLSFANLDVVQHDVTAQDRGSDGRPLFQSKLIGLGETAPVEGVEKLQSGKSYAFYCTVHPGMRGTLVVQ